MTATETTGSFEQARAVADAVLYEGYLLYPYRKSSPKNRVRWQFGVLAPRPWIEARGPLTPTVAGSGDSWFQQTECLLEPSRGAVVHVRVRFLQLQRKQVEQVTEEAFRRVESLEHDGAVHLSFEEAVEREFDAVVAVDEAMGAERAFTLDVPGGEDVERIGAAARIVRTRWPLALVLAASGERAGAPFPLVRLRVRIENAVTDLDPRASREEALRRSLVASHAFVGVSRGAIVSLLEPPEWASSAAAAAENLFTFPVLVGEPGRRDLVLSSPIILYDHPRVAPESPGDLFDATEIDEILSLRTLTLTDEEKREVRATDRRGAAIVDRVDSMPPEVLQRLHGAIRSLRPRGEASRDAGGASDAVPWWSPEAETAVSPDSDAVEIDGRAVSKGSRVILRPRATGGDAHDMFLRGRTGRVEAVFLDVDGATHLAVTVEDDPAAELHQWYGRFRYFGPDEVEPLDDEAELGG